MSYILDALKHSQDSRSRGAIPGLGSQAATVRPGPSRRERIWRLVALATLVLLLAVLAVMAWQRWLGAAPAPERATPPVAAQPAGAPASVAQAPAAAVGAPVARTAPAATPVPGEPAAAPGESTAPGLEALKELAGVRVDVDEPQPAPAPKSGAAAAGPPPIVQKLELPVERPPLAAPTAKPQPLVPAMPRDEASSAPEPQSAEYGDVEHWKELPAPIQRQLRETPFNVHIYSSDPKLRFVKSGGRTLREGDAINEELRVLHITRDGVIVGYKGGKYWMRLS